MGEQSKDKAIDEHDRSGLRHSVLSASVPQSGDVEELWAVWSWIERSNGAYYFDDLDELIEGMRFTQRPCTAGCLQTCGRQGDSHLGRDILRIRATKCRR